MLRRTIQKDLKDFDLQLPACMMAYRGAVHEPAGISPNLLILGRKLEVPLDVVTERSPDALPLKADYALAVQERMVSAYDLARLHYDRSGTTINSLLVDRHCWYFVWLHNVPRKKGRNTRNLTVLWKHHCCRMW